MINGERVRQARELRGLTQVELARRVGVEQPTIARVEAGIQKPSDSLIQAISMQTGFPVAFFGQGTGPEFPLGSLLFRAHASTTLREKTEAYRYAQVLFEISEALASKMKPMTLRLPQLTEPPADAASITRAWLGLSPDTPIPNLLRAVESAGVIVLALPIDLEGRDAFSLWAGVDQKKPVIFLSSDRPGDRVRWNIAHELGHMVLHHAIKGQISSVEREADEFAAELLMPESAMRREITTPATLISIAALKPRWRVAIQALVRRAHDLSLVTDRQYRYFFEQIGVRGWRKREPAHFDVPVEKPRALRKMAEILYGEPPNLTRMADDLKLAPEFLGLILGGHADGSEFAGGSKPTRRANVLPLRRGT
jgi:Zn-dependent peptidase ImmA (M78 family)/DNA-binding XRE family transcriptional regulator